MTRTRRKTTGRGRKGSAQTSAAQLHRNWLQLVMTDGPFLAAPPLKDAWPQGMPSLRQLHDAYDTGEDVDIMARLRDHKAAFEQAWDVWHRALADDDPQEREGQLGRYREARDTWVEFVLRDMLGWEHTWVPLASGSAEAAPWRAMSPNEMVCVEPTGLMRLRDQVGALVLVVDPMQGDLSDACDDGWSANALDRMAAMLRAGDGDCPIGVVTDGRWWAIVSAPEGASASWGQFDSQMWVDTPQVRDAFAALLDVRLLVGKPEDRLSALFAKSVTAAEEVTNALGVQVRQAVELMVAAFSEASARARESGQPDPLPEDGEEIYEAAVTVMMRVVFLLFAQERGLLPQGLLFEKGYGLAGVLDDLDALARGDGEETMDGTSMVWHRLLATSQALYYGASFEDMRLPAYGGSVFDPERHPFLTALDERGELAVTVPDRVMYHVLRSVQIANVGKEARRISFRDINVEQIGYIYEDLLGYTCCRADGIVLGLRGTVGEEPEMPLDTLEQVAGGIGAQDDPKGSKRASAIAAWVKEHAPTSKTPTPASMAKSLVGPEAEDGELALLAVTRDATLRDRLRPWLGLIRRDLRGKPVVFLKDDLYVTETPSRKNAGAHYTPTVLADDVVRHTLEPLVYKPGPYQTNDRDKWRPISSDDLLDLHVADIACGSGAFLVAAGRYLADRLVEAWQREGTTPGGTPEQVRNRAMRQVVAKCLYGADINEMAVEMCKLSLWLVSLDPHLPFSFVDNKVFHGNSLLGVTDLQQLKTLRIDAKPQQAQGSLFLDLAGGDMVDAVDVDGILRKVRRLRDQLSSEINDDDPQRSAAAKRRQMREIGNTLAQVRMIADGVVAASLEVGGKPGKKLEDAYANLAVAAGRAFPAHGEADDTMLRSIVKRGLTPTVPTDYEQWRCLHWPLEIPEVMENGGFDAIIGNPPFLGGQKLTGAMGENMRDWYVNVLAGGRRGSADLCAYFYLRAFNLLRRGGVLGLLATNTIAQGDTREVGLDQMVERGFTITRAIQSQSWTVASANVEYAVVWGVRGRVGDDILKDCDGMKVRRIATLLEPAGRINTPPPPTD